MKNSIGLYHLLYAIIVITLFSCNRAENQNSQSFEGERNSIKNTWEEAYFGKKINDEDALPALEVNDQLKVNDSLQMKIIGKVTEVCQKKGCWIKMNIGNGETMQVKFKDYGFFVPMDAAGQTVVIDGVAKKEIMSVANLQHYAEDAGKSKEEINAINKPEEKIVFVAEGVLLKK